MAVVLNSCCHTPYQDSDNQNGAHPLPDEPEILGAGLLNFGSLLPDIQNLLIHPLFLKLNLLFVCHF